MIEFKDVKKVFQSNKQQIEALTGINLKVEQGDIYGVIGYSGAGKSTLIRMVNLLERPSEGAVLVNGINLASLKPSKLRQEKKKIGMIFQHFNLLNSKTVFDNIAMPLVLSRTPKTKIKARVSELLKFVGLADKAKNYPDQLSGGQKQRIGIARALATNPSILLCDEATSALDPQTTSEVLQLLKKINAEYNITILLITHEMSVIREICNKVAVMEYGKVVENGSVFNIFSNPQSTIAKNFVRTVIHDEVPKSILNELHASKKSIWKINFIGTSSGRPLLSTLAKKFDVDISVLSANISEIQDTPFGNLIVDVTGEQDEITKAYQFAKDENVSLQEVVADGQ
ncbi:methionine ABC transporter ATP-binding protein [Niallia sp. 03190]|uniref:methionine ABC transporter ATP-binding protein n=1 Tax=Niallia sp. 03190 TaxID=3458061 RepID=UPI004044352C